MRTFYNHLVGVTVDQPHPQSYRPDLPLRIDDGSSETSEAFSEGYNQGYCAGTEAEEARVRRREMTVAAVV